MEKSLLADIPVSSATQLSEIHILSPLCSMSGVLQRRLQNLETLWKCSEMTFGLSFRRSHSCPNDCLYEYSHIPSVYQLGITVDFQTEAFHVIFFFKIIWISILNYYLQILYFTIKFYFILENHSVEKQLRSLTVYRTVLYKPEMWEICGFEVTFLLPGLNWELSEPTWLGTILLHIHHPYIPSHIIIKQV